MSHVTRAVLLAAGQGLRLRPHTETRPKCLLEAAPGLPLLDVQRAVLAAEGVGEHVLVAGWLSHALEGRGLTLLVNERFAATNMVWTLLCARERMAEGAVVGYGDIAYPREALRAVLDAPGDLAVAVDLDWEPYWRKRFGDPLKDAETLAMRGGLLTEIGGKPSSLAEIEGQYIGLMRFSATGAQQLWATFDACRARGSINGKTPEKAYMTDLLQEVIRAGLPLTAAPFHGGWVEIDTPEDLALPETALRVLAIAQSVGLRPKGPR
jgi:choline kinase